MNELLQEKARLEEKIKFHDEQHKESVRMANIYRRQLKTIERAMEVIPKESDDSGVIQEVSEGLK
jgi:hemerythrin